MALLFIVTVLLYLAIIGGFIIGFDKVAELNLKDLPAKTKFSVVIPFRNEAAHLDSLLKSIFKLNYPKHLFEVVLVNDASEDASINIINERVSKHNDNTTAPINIKVIDAVRNTNAPKKDAITTAIKTITNTWIVTTDADCIVPQNWLNAMDVFIQYKSPNCIVAPVTYRYTGTFLNRFQILDMYSLQGTTIGAFGLRLPFLCNGANFAYKKSVFETVNGFDGNTNIASGDDVFLLEKIVKEYPHTAHYLKCKNAIVSTQSLPSWSALISQRIRWAAKTKGYSHWFGKFTGIIVFLTNLFTLLLLLLVAFGGFNHKIWVYGVIIKLHLDFLLLYKTSAFFSQRQAFKSYLSSFLLYPFFCTYVAALSMFKGYSWKGRNFKM